MATWAGIVRVSHMGTRRATDDSFHANRDQQHLIEGAVPKGDTLRMLPAELNVSGGLPLEARPSLLAAVQGVENGTYAGIIVAYLSRLGRNVGEQIRTFDRVHAAGGQIIVAQEGIDARTRGGRLQRNILAAIHEDEREMHAERFEERRRLATQAGIWQRRQTPLGYQRDPNTRRLVIDRPAARRVRRAFDARAAGTAMVGIARALGMTPSGARQLLANRVYLGELKVGAHINAAAHPPIVTVEQFDAAQRAQATRPARGSRTPALLAGLIRCAGCGHVMSRTTARQPVYTCHVDHSAGRCQAPAAITVAVADPHVETVALTQLALLQATAHRDTRPLEDARRDLRGARDELAAFLQAVDAAGLGVNETVDAIRTRNERIDEAQQRVDRLAEHDAVRVDGDPVSVWERLDGHQRNRLLRSLIETVIVQRAGRGRVIPVGDRVQVVAYGAGIVSGYRGGGQPLPVAPLVGLDVDDPRVLRVNLGE